MDPAPGFPWIIPFNHPVVMEEMLAQFKRIKESPSFSFLGLPVACLSHSIPGFLGLSFILQTATSENDSMTNNKHLRCFFVVLSYQPILIYGIP